MKRCCELKHCKQMPSGTSIDFERVTFTGLGVGAKPQGGPMSVEGGSARRTLARLSPRGADCGLWKVQDPFRFGRTPLRVSRCFPRLGTVREIAQAKRHIYKESPRPCLANPMPVAGTGMGFAAVGCDRGEMRMSERPWWQHGAIYQLLVPSFLDTDGDGLGDLDGVTARLDYLEWLGITALWLSPCYPSPLKELGYDVSDYCNIEPRFGSMKAFDRLLDEAHRRELRVILDWVGNHTSAQHPWFREARSSRSSARRNWYLWRDALPDGSPPNNWVSVFGGSSWQWDAATSQYYMHTFLDSQPDLNWREPQVRAAMRDALKFWLDRGVDGFRLDAAPLFFKDPAWRDNPPNPDYRPGDLPDSTQLPIHTRNQPGLHELFAELRGLLDRYPGDRVLLGEFYVPFPELVTFYGDRVPELHLPLNLSLTWSKWDADTIGRTIAEYQARVVGRG
ncbi:MAG: hypothetical protein EHM50_08915, partial [Lysobacterales bacterium]